MLCDMSPIAKPPDFPWLVYVTFRYKGRPLPTQAEFDAFETVERAIEELERGAVLAWVGTMTHGGVRDYICYCRDNRECRRDLSENVGRAKHDVKFVNDPTWSQYRDLVAMIRSES